MDYSASINDAENPAADSPWGNSPSSSPRPNRSTNFAAAIGAEPPASPFNIPSQGPNNGLSDESAFGAIDSGFQRPGTSSSVSAPDFQPEYSPSQEQSHQEGPPPPAGESQQQTQRPTGEHGQQQQQAQQQGQRQHQQQPARRPQPQFKLQAKITGLERTGRKDPILRFDVHVCARNPWAIGSEDTS